MMRVLVVLFAAVSLLAAPAGAQEPVVEVVPEPAAPTALVFEEPRRSWSVGVAATVGVTVPTSDLGAMVVGGLELDLALPVLERRLVIALAATLTRPATSGTGTDPRVGGAYEYDLAVTELKLGLDLVYRFFTAERDLVPYLGAGPLLHFLRSTETTTLAPGDNTEQGTALGFEVLGGLDYRLGPGLLLGELRYVYSKLDHLWTGDASAGNVVIAVGYRLVF
jgi:opacity protein-like surface antigen